MVLFDQYKDLNSVKVNLSSDYDVIESNADYHKGNVYTWNLSRTNNKGIYIEYRVSNSNTVTNDNDEDEEIVIEDNEDDENTEDEMSLVVAFGVVLLAILGFIVIVMIINKFDRLRCWVRRPSTT